MILLLNSVELRRMRLGEILAEAEDWVVLPDLAKDLQCSVRVLQDDFAYYAENFTDFQIVTSVKGVKMQFHKEKTLISLYNKLLSHSLAYQIMEIAFLEDGILIGDLADKVSTSVSTIYRTVQHLNIETEKFGFKMETSPCRITGDEKNIRYFFYQYFNEKYTFLDKWYDPKIDQALDPFLHFFIDFTNISADYAFYNFYKLVTVVNLIRYKHGHYVDTENISINFDEIIPDLMPFHSLFRDFEKQLEIEVNGNLINQIFTPYVQEGFSLSVDRLYEKAERNLDIRKNIATLDDILMHISKAHSIPLNNKENVIWSLLNSAHLEYREPQSGSILYNRNKYFAEDIQENFPRFYESLYTGMKEFRRFLGKPLTENGIYFFIYKLFTYWEDLIPELRKKLQKIRVIIISDRHVTHGYMLKDFIENEFSKNLSIDIYTAAHIDKETVQKLNYDLIISNFPMSSYENKQIVYIENIPNQNDLVKLQHAMSKISQNQ